MRDVPQVFDGHFAVAQIDVAAGEAGFGQAPQVQHDLQKRAQLLVPAERRLDVGGQDAQHLRQVFAQGGLQGLEGHNAIVVARLGDALPLMHVYIHVFSRTSRLRERERRLADPQRSRQDQHGV